MRVNCSPTLDRWQALLADEPSHAEHDANGPHREGPPNSPQALPIIATGHQAAFWHPGILAKYLAVEIACKRLDSRPLDCVVDQDTNDPLSLAVPLIDDGRLSVNMLSLGETTQGVPTGFQAAVDVDNVLGRMDQAIANWGKRLAVDLAPLRNAWDRAGRRASTGSAHRSLAEQVVSVAGVLLPLRLHWDRRFASDLFQESGSQAILDAMRHDPTACAQAYNQAVAQVPDAGITSLRVLPDRVELPLWWLRWNQARQRVFAVRVSEMTNAWRLESADGLIEAAARDTRVCVGQSTTGRPPTLAPRALLLTGLVRRHHADLFVHGTGGGNYDRITDRWFNAWRDETLSPSTVVTADLTLDLDVPIANAADHRRAVWRRHHLPHNLDRELKLAGESVNRKRELLAHMDDDRDRRRRADAFAEIHRINRSLAEQHKGAIAEAEADVMWTQRGVSNQHIATKRDWPFPFYDDAAIDELRSRIADHVTV